MILPSSQFGEAKLSRNVGILFKLNKDLPTSALITLYYALVHPFLFYGISVWRSTNKTFFTKLRSLQNKALKAIGHLGWHVSPKHLYSKFKILKLDDVYKTELSLFTELLAKILRNILTTIIRKSRNLINLIQDQIKSSLYSRYYAEACNEWRGPSPRLSA